MKLTSRTLNDRDRLLRFSNYVGLHKIKLWLILLAVTALVTVPFILQFTGFGVDAKVIIAFCLVLIVDIFYLVSYFVVPRYALNRSPLLGLTIVFTFLDSIFAMDALTKKGSDRSTFKYSELVKVRESKQDLYLYITKSQAFIVDKSGFSEEELTELKKYINSKIEGKNAKK